MQYEIGKKREALKNNKNCEISGGRFPGFLGSCNGVDCDKYLFWIDENIIMPYEKITQTRLPQLII